MHFFPCTTEKKPKQNTTKKDQQILSPFLPLPSKNQTSQTLPRGRCYSQKITAALWARGGEITHRGSRAQPFHVRNPATVLDWPHHQNLGVKNNLGKWSAPPPAACKTLPEWRLWQGCFRVNLTLGKNSSRKHMNKMNKKERSKHIPREISLRLVRKPKYQYLSSQTAVWFTS